MRGADFGDDGLIPRMGGTALNSNVLPRIAGCLAALPHCRLYENFCPEPGASSVENVPTATTAAGGATHQA